MLSYATIYQARNRRNLRRLDGKETGTHKSALFHKPNRLCDVTHKPAPFSLVYVSPLYGALGVEPALEFALYVGNMHVHAARNRTTRVDVARKRIVNM